MANDHVHTQSVTVGDAVAAAAADTMSVTVLLLLLLLVLFILFRAFVLRAAPTMTTAALHSWYYY